MHVELLGDQLTKRCVPGSGPVREDPGAVLPERGLGAVGELLDRDQIGRDGLAGKRDRLHGASLDRRLQASVRGAMIPAAARAS